jgi:hypothetical protein
MIIILVSLRGNFMGIECSFLILLDNFMRAWGN